MLPLQKIKKSSTESVGEFLTKSKVFSGQMSRAEVFYDTKEDLILANGFCNNDRIGQRRSSKIGEEQNEKELNSIFRRIYNRHRYSLGGADSGQMKIVSSSGIKRFSNTNNLSSF